MSLSKVEPRGSMRSEHLQIASRDGGKFDCYAALPSGRMDSPAIVLASAIFGVDADIRGMADVFASKGFLALAPNLFWRDGTGPLPIDDERAAKRSQPRLEKIATGERDLHDVRTWLETQHGFNGRAAIIGFCYGGPYAIIGPRRLGYDAGISCHGTQMLDYVSELEGLTKPICFIWGDADSRAPAPVLDAYRQAATRMSNVEVHIFSGVKHGYMMRGISHAFDAHAYEFSMAKATAVLERLRRDEVTQPIETG